MTIHQSKGLEFDAVIIPTLESALAPRAPTYAVSRNLKTQKINEVFMYRKAELRELLPKRYNDACKGTIAESVSESLCLLYVALTRAERALYLIGPCQPNSPKSPPFTSAGIIQMAIRNIYSQTPNDVVYANGNPIWFEQLPAYEADSPDPEILPIPLARPSESELSPLTSSAPSSRSASERFLLSGVLRSSSETAKLLGTQLHYFMEQIDWAQGTYWAMARDAFITKYGEVSPELESHLAMFLENAPLANILNKDFYFDEPSSPLTELTVATHETIQFTVHNEYPICALIDGELLRGFIDRLVVMRINDLIVAVDICDYKTDRIDVGPNELQNSVSRYRPQIYAYKQSIAQMLTLSPSQVGARLVFTHTGVQVAV